MSRWQRCCKGWKGAGHGAVQGLQALQSVSFVLAVLAVLWGRTLMALARWLLLVAAAVAVHGSARVPPSERAGDGVPILAALYNRCLYYDSGPAIMGALAVRSVTIARAKPVCHPLKLPSFPFWKRCASGDAWRLRAAASAEPTRNSRGSIACHELLLAISCHSALGVSVMAGWGADRAGCGVQGRTP